MEKPRGLRNNNPGNIRISKDRWKGLAKEQTDSAFFVFTDIKYGYRALIRILQNYRSKYGCMTVAEMITRWAPSSENNTPAYIRKVCQDMQVPSVYVPDVSDKTTMCAMAAAISRVENGIDTVMTDVEAGWSEL
jgi:hypothetical protein